MFEVQKINNENIISVIKFLMFYEKSCIDLLSKILLLKNNLNSDLTSAFLFLHNKEIIAVFALEIDGTFLFCFPNLTHKNIKAFFSYTKHFFKTQNIKTIMGLRNFSDYLQKYLQKHFNYTVSKSSEYFLLYKDYSNYKNIKTFSDERLNFSVCTSADIEKLLPIEIGYEIEELEIKKTSAFFSRHYLSKMLAKQIVFKCEAENKIVARVHTNAIGINCKQLGGVYTLPEFRRRGISKKLLNYVMDYLSADTKTFVLFVKVQNTPAIKLYKSLNFKKHDNFKIIQITKI